MKQIIILLSIFFWGYFSSQNLNNERFIIYKLKSEKKLKKSKTNELRYQTIYGHSKSEFLHSDFEKDLIKFGYKKVENQKSNQIFEKIESLKEGKNIYETACMKVYRDILVYKNQNNILKVIKICTSCYSNQIITQKNQSELLMNFEDYDFLEELLR